MRLPPIPSLPKWPTWAVTALTNLQIDVSAIRHALLEIPTRTQLNRIEEKLMTSLDTLQAAVTRNGEAVASAVTGLADLRTKVGALQAVVDAGTVDPAQLAAITASIDASTDAIAQALTPVVEDPETPTGSVDVPFEQNPATADPETVPGAVEAGQPLEVS